jgi:hypothetical protein
MEWLVDESNLDRQYVEGVQFYGRPMTVGSLWALPIQ